MAGVGRLQALWAPSTQAIDQTIGAVYYTRGQYPQALESYTRVLPATTDRARHAMLQIEIGVAYVTMADERGLPYLHDALNTLDPATQTKDVARAMLWLGRYHYFRAQYSQALTYLERAPVARAAQRRIHAAFCLSLYGSCADAFGEL